MFEVLEISLGTTDRLFKYKLQFPEVRGFGLKAFDNGWVLDSHTWIAGERVLDVGGAYSWLPSHLQHRYGCEVWVADDFGMDTNDEFWLRHRSPQEFIAQHPENKYILERLGNPATSSLPDSGFDVVYSVSTLEHVPNGVTSAVWKHMARLLKPGGELIHAIDVPFPSNGGLKRILKSLALDQFSGLLPHDIIQAYAKATPLAYASTVWFALGLPRSSLRHRNLGTARMVVDPQIVVESYEHGLNRVLKDDPNYVYKRQGSLLIHLKRYDRRSAA